MEGFEILEKLGDGAYSIVYKVRRKEDSNIYALKKVKLKGLSDKEKQNALNEVRILASVKSPFVISYKEAFIEEETETLCIVMEYADKGDLYQKIVHLKKIGCLIEEIDAWKIFIQMVRGLKSLHDLKILHRDLKSANIFLFSNGTAKIGDLNVSKVAQKGLGYTQTGTPYYASPEVWNENPYDNKSDIWSLGCVTYEMLTLHPPFRAKDMEQLYNRVIKGQYKRIGEKYSNDMNEIIEFLLKVNPKDRPNCDEILKHPIIKKRLEFFQAQAGENETMMDNIDEGVLLRTIRIPKNIIFLSDNLPEKNYEKSKSHSKAMGRNIHKFTNNTTQNNNNNSLPNIKIINNLKTSNLRSLQMKNNSITNHNNNDIKEAKDITNTNNTTNKNDGLDLNKGMKNEKSNIVVNRNIIYNINNVVNINNKNGLKNEKINLSKSPPHRQLINKYENDNLNNLNLLQIERRKLYGKNILPNKKRKIDDIYKHYIPMYGNNKLLSINKYGINTKSNNEINKHENYLPNIYNNKSLGNNYSNNIGNKIIINRRLKPILSKKF
jgi:NIMA (never in mitosis gene a)-related kinase